MNDQEWAVEYARRLTTIGATYVPEDIAALLRSQAAEIEGWKADQKENLRNQCDLHAEIERLKVESNEMALIGVRSVADVLELRAEIERLKPWAAQPAAQLGAEMGQRVVALEAEVERLKQEQAEPVGYVDDYNSCGYYVANTPTNTYKTLKPVFRTAPQGQTALLLQVQAFLNRVTHWQEGKPDLHDIKVAIKEALK